MSAGQLSPGGSKPHRAFISAVLCILAVLGGPALPHSARAQQADVIRGRVIGPDSLPVESATVTATTLTGNVSRSARTDRNGRYTLTFPGGEGDYMVSFAALGFAPRRFEVKRTADEEILVADAKLARAAVTLDAMKVTAPREKVARNDAPPDISGSERPVTNEALPAADLGDLAAMAATLPGVQLAPGQNGDPNGFSVLGLGADQNNMTLNGLSFGGSNLPRDATVVSSLVTSPYDVSRGGFSGAQFSLRSRPGSNFSMRGMSLNLDSPHLQWTDRAARALGQQYSNVSLGGMAAGPLRMDRAFYSVSYQAGRRANDYQSLLNTDALGLATAGVSADSVARFLDILRRAGIPASVGRLPSDRLNESGSVFGTFDLAPPGSASGQALSLNVNGSWNRQTPMGGAPTEVPAYEGDRTNWRGGAQASHNAYFGVGILSETTVGASLSRAWSSPYVELPAGRVLVSSRFVDGSSATQNLSFGGSPFMDAAQTSNTLSMLNQMSWFSANNKHRLKLTSELRRDGFSQEQGMNLRGSFVFNSLADLEAGRASAYTRQLSSRRRETSQLVGALSLGDAYRPTPNLQLQYGVRLDGNRFLDAPAANADVARVFGVSNRIVPNDLYASPRLGFSWTYGAAPQIAAFAGAARIPRAVVRGGVGVFQNTPGTTLIGNALDNTGLPGGIQQIMCTGAATPVPDWAAYTGGPGAIPDRCADGSSGTVFSSGAPNVSLIAPDYKAPRSIRSNLQWNGPVLGNRLAATIDATVSLNRNQAGLVDRNFAGVQAFALDDEENRPVYVQTGSIFPATGAIAPQDSRVSSLFNRVGELRSDLRSESRQLTVRIAPTRFSTRFSWGASYVYSNVRDLTRGFQSTTGNPFDVAWSRSSYDSRHQLVYNLSYNFFNTLTASWYGQFRSGAPFTPLVASDVNGDGYANDRAFIFNPATANDPAIAAGISDLLARGSAAARSCLQSQLGHLAKRSSCEGPWTSTATLSLTFNPVKVRMPQRASISFQLSNPLGAADALLHGQGGLHGWGQQAIPDANLLYVQGFDPVEKRFRYSVNNRFGATLPSSSAFRTPVTLTALMRFDVGPTRERQSLSMQLDRGRRVAGQKLPEAFLKVAFGSGSVPNPMAQILRQQDSLGLSALQADSIAAMNRWYSIRVDSIWTPVARFLSALPDRYDQGEAYEHYLAARQASVDLLARIVPSVNRLLTPAQRRMLPPFVASYLEPRYLASIRSGTASFTGGGPLMAGGMMMGGAVMMPAAGGGTMIQVIRTEH